MSQPTKPIQFSAAALAACLLLSACGGGDAEAPPLIATAPAPAPTPVPPPPAPPAPPAPAPAGTALATFDEATPPAIVEFGGAGYAIEAGPAGGSANALRITRPGGDVFAGAFVTTAPIPFSATRKTITARVYSPTAGIPMIAKAEYADNTGTGDTAPTTAVVVGWQTLTWVFNNVDLTKSYTRFTILPNLGTVGSGQSYFFDDIALAPESAAPPPPPAPAGSVLVSFDEATPPGIGNFGGASVIIEPGPTGGSGNALKITRPGGQAFAGGFVITAPIAFSATRKTITARVYSPTAGAPMVAKAEYAENAGTGETSPTTAVVAGWQTLTWVFNNVDLTKSYTVFVILPNLGTVGTGQSYFIDDVTLAPAVAAPAPAPVGVDTVITTFDETAPPPVTEFGGAGYAIEAGPTGGSGKALKITRPGGDVFAGAWVAATPPIPFSSTRKTITARVYSPTAGVPMIAKAEYAENAGTGDTAPTAAVVAGWQTLTWVFNNVDLSKSYTRFTILPNLGTVGTGQSYFFDDITLLAGAAEAPPPPPPVPTTIATLDETTAALTGFEGCYDSTLVTDPAGGTNKVGKVVKPGSGVPFYCGTTVVTVPNGGLQRIAFTASATTMTARVWSPDVGIPVRLKVEDIADGTKSVETEATTTVVGWQTLTFDFANAASGTPVLNLASTYNKASIFFDFGTLGSGKTYYFDDVTFVTGTGTDTVLVTFDERNFDNTESQPSILNGFGGAENSVLVGFADGGVPADGAKNGKLAKVVKNNAFTYAGTSMQRKPNDAVPTIPLTNSATRMSVRVFSAYVGMRVHLKVENATYPPINTETDAFTTVANTWETLIFDLGPAGPHAIPTGPGPTDYSTSKLTQNLSVALGAASAQGLNVTNTFNKVSIFFDFGLGDAGYAAMPGTRTYYFDDVKFVGP